MAEQSNLGLALTRLGKQTRDVAYLQDAIMTSGPNFPSNRRAFTLAASNGLAWNVLGRGGIVGRSAPVFLYEGCGGQSYAVESKSIIGSYFISVVHRVQKGGASLPLRLTNEVQKGPHGKG